MATGIASQPEKSFSAAPDTRPADPPIPRAMWRVSLLPAVLLPQSHPRALRPKDESTPARTTSRQQAHFARRHTATAPTRHQAQEVWTDNGFRKNDRPKRHKAGSRHTASRFLSPVVLRCGRIHSGEGENDKNNTTRRRGQIHAQQRMFQKVSTPDFNSQEPIGKSY